MMRARHWIQTAMSGLTGFAAVSLCVAFVVSARESDQGARVVPVGGPFCLAPSRFGLVPTGKLR